MISAPIETKVAAGGLTGAVVTIVMMGLQQYLPGFHMTPEAVALIVTVASSLAGYRAPHTPRAPAVQPPRSTTLVPVSSARPQ